MSERKKYRLVYLVTHPIQYQAPLLRLLNAQPDIDLTVLFQSDQTIRSFRDTGFLSVIKWDVPLIEGYRHEFLPAFGSRARVTKWLPISYGIVKRLRQGNFDILWIYGYARWFNWVAIIAAWKASIPILIRDEATPISTHRGAVKALLKKPFFALLDRLCAGFLAIGTLNRQYYLQNGIAAARIFSVPYCVDNDYFANLARDAAAKRDEFRGRLGLEPGRSVILFASKFEPRKRPGDLLRAFKRMIVDVKGGPKPYLLFVGDGELRAEIEAEARPLAEDVRFLGFRNQSELPAFFDLCAVFVLPSEQEPWGLIVNEVMSAGRPVVVSDQVGCWPDLVRDGGNGYVYPCGNIDALAELLRKILQSSDAAAMGRASVDIMRRWNFQNDIDGLRAAIATAVER